MTKEKARTFHSEVWDCDGFCGSSVSLSSPVKEPDLAPALAALGWIVISKDESYCPDCQKKAKRIEEAKKGGHRA